MNCTELTQSILNIKAQMSEFDTAVSARNSEGAILIKKQIKEELDKHKPEIAKHILGEDFLGPEEIKAVFGLETIEVPPIPFSKEELERAKELGQMLILRLPITMAEINEKLRGKVKDGKKLLYSFDESTGELKDDCWYKDEPFYTTQTARAGWALVTKHVLGYKDGKPEEDLTRVSTSKDYLKQTEILIKYLQDEVFEGGPIPPQYQEAIDKFEEEKTTKKPEELTINKLLRRLPVEILYDIAVYFQITGERLLANIFDWSSVRYSDGDMVSVGYFGSDGINVDWNWPGYPDANVGAVFSRSQ